MNTFEIDKITWNDLSLDEIYLRLNLCDTSAGSDYLYKRLKHPFVNECEEFIHQSLVFDDVNEHIKESGDTSEISKLLLKISKLSSYSFTDELDAFKNEAGEKNTKHFVTDLCVLVSFALIFVYPGPGIVLFFAMIAYSVSQYFKTKNIIASKLSVFNYIIKIIRAINKTDMESINKDRHALYKDVLRLKDIAGIFRPFMSCTFLISEGARTESNPLSILFDYVRMIFHVDIIKYNSMLGFIKTHIAETLEMYEIIGCIDSALAFAKLTGKGGFLECCELCKPEFDNNNKCVEIGDCYHPLIKNAVTNTVKTDKNILITGCNASGKSTFLRTVMLSALFSQSFNMAFAKSYRAPFFALYSSMSLKDDINEGQSYFMSEIKSLKRILDDKESKMIFCVIDEVLRGTNTVERIAASIELLKSLCSERTLCFAATHDTELTELLSGEYDNFHFMEEIVNEDVTFSYKLSNGPASSRNAIRLLSVLGYDKEIVDRATKRAEHFLECGTWT